jgi:Uma2 family endonuclease
LVVEVAESSLAVDRTLRKELYAAAGIPLYWIVNLVDRRLEVFTGPSGPTPHPDYATTTILGPGDEVALILDGQEVGRIPVAALLP